MGENEQGGMLRNVVVIGIIAMIALIITLGVVGLKSNMSKNTDIAVGTASMNRTGDSEFMNPISATGPSTNGNSWYQPAKIYNSGSWHIAGKYRNSNYIMHTPAANEPRSDLLSQRQEISNNVKSFSYGAWVKGEGAIQISGCANDYDDAGNSWYWKRFNVSDWTYISESNVYMNGGFVDEAKYVSFEIISFHGSPVSLAQPMIKFTNNIGSVDYIPTD